MMDDDDDRTINLFTENDGTPNDHVLLVLRREYVCLNHRRMRNAIYVLPVTQIFNKLS